MRTFKITLEYDGTRFCGWQSQSQGERTVQDTIEAVLSKIFKHPVCVVASGRTDSGVHAAGQVISFRADTRMTPPEIMRAMNRLLPEDIAVRGSREVKAGFHAQKSAVTKTYRYTVLSRCVRSVFLRQYAYFYSYPLNIAKMRRAAKVLVGRHDFRSFQASDPPRSEQQTVRTVKKIAIKKKGDMVTFDITANGFLYKMVRNITGTLLAIGSGQLAPDEMPKILKAKSRQKAWSTAPAHGLCLVSVQY